MALADLEQQRELASASMASMARSWGEQEVQTARWLGELAQPVLQELELLLELDLAAATAGPPAVGLPVSWAVRTPAPESETRPALPLPPQVMLAQPEGPLQEQPANRVHRRVDRQHH